MFARTPAERQKAVTITKLYPDRVFETGSEDRAKSDLLQLDGLVGDPGPSAAAG